MDLAIIGKFIAERRKEKNLTQAKLAEKLFISEKTVSKWECGKGFPDTTLILPLCEILEISANELLSGKKLSQEEYHEKAEDNLVHLINERRENKKKLILSIVVTIITLLSAIPLIMLSGYLDISITLRIILISIAIIIIILGIGVACVLDRDAGHYICPHCKTKFTPDMKSYIMGAHTLTTRYLKCPSCGKSSYCKHKLIGK